MKKPLPESELKSKLTRLALSYLSYRPRFSSEIVSRLEKAATKLDLDAAVFESLVTQILTRLKKERFVNDRQLLQDTINHLLFDRLKGPFFIHQKLKRLGLDNATIKAALNRYVSPQKQLQAAQKIVAKKPHHDRARLARLLASRGFPYSIISQLID